MCLITEQKEPIILEEDLTCYKVVDVYDNQIYSPFNSKKWKIDRLYKQKICKSTDYGALDDFERRELIHDYGENFDKILISYGKGFHSSKTKNRLNRVNNADTRKIVKCIIPKGSEVYYSITGLIVSNQLKIVEILDEY